MQRYVAPCPDINSERTADSWFAVLTKARHEKVVAQRFLDKGLQTFFPVVTEVHRWRDRKKAVEVPLFSCYLFVKLMPGNEERQRVLRTDSVLGFVGAVGTGTPIPEEQIDSVRILVQKSLPYSHHPFLQVGQRVRIRNGALQGVEGILLSRRGDSKLIISIEAMQRSLSVQIDGYDLEPI
ncbi:MAG TPA: UpxY family transcription antiterminator [Alloacidobacterium sp.]|nr:UpxY family transcription antiterminator [Alloacidobacterium sp.]